MGTNIGEEGIIEDDVVENKIFEEKELVKENFEVDCFTEGSIVETKTLKDNVEEEILLGGNVVVDKLMEEKAVEKNNVEKGNIREEGLLGGTVVESKILIENVEGNIGENESLADNVDEAGLLGENVVVEEDIVEKKLAKEPVKDDAMRKDNTIEQECLFEEDAVAINIMETILKDLTNDTGEEKVTIEDNFVEYKEEESLKENYEEERKIDVMNGNVTEEDSSIIIVEDEDEVLLEENVKEEEFSEEEDVSGDEFQEDDLLEDECIFFENIHEISDRELDSNFDGFTENEIKDMIGRRKFLENVFLHLGFSLEEDDDDDYSSLSYNVVDDFPSKHLALALLGQEM